MTYIDVSPLRLALAVGFIGVAAGVSVRYQLGLVRELAIGTLRAATQLVVIGYVLLGLFAHQRADLVMAIVTLMWLTAAATSARRIEHGPSFRRIFPYAVAAIGGGAAIALIPLFAFIVVPRPWFDARYVIPLGGMMLSSAMNVVAQVFERLFASANADAPTIEQLLLLGASPRQALMPQTRLALRSALIPTINGLLTVGLVALPGMMTGQIVSGTNPEQAVRYQLVIMYQLTAVAAFSGALAAEFARRLLFTEREQLALTKE